MSVDCPATAKHLKSTLTAKGLHKDMIIGSEVEGTNLVVEWKRLNVPAGLPNTPQKLDICFANAASAAYAKEVLTYGTVDPDTEARKKIAPAQKDTTFAAHARAFPAW